MHSKDSEFNLYEFFEVLKLRRYTIIGVVLVSLASGYAYTIFAKPIYKATVHVASRQQIFDNPDWNLILGELRILLGTESPVVNQLALKPNDLVAELLAEFGSASSVADFLNLMDDDLELGIDSLSVNELLVVAGGISAGYLSSDGLVEYLSAGKRVVVRPTLAFEWSDPEIAAVWLDGYVNYLNTLVADNYRKRSLAALEIYELSMRQKFDEIGHGKDPLDSIGQSLAFICSLDPSCSFEESLVKYVDLWDRLVSPQLVAQTKAEQANLARRIAAVDRLKKFVSNEGSLEGAVLVDKPAVIGGLVWPNRFLILVGSLVFGLVSGFLLSLYFYIYDSRTSQG